MINMTEEEAKRMTKQLYMAQESIIQLKAELRDCRNELCERCGNYREKHNGACDGCRWKDMG